MHEILETVAKVGGGAFALYFGQWLTSYIKSATGDKSKKNGHSFCGEHSDLMKKTVENNTILKSMRSENQDARTMARDERNKLFNYVGEIKDSVSTVKTDIAVLKNRVQKIENNPDEKNMAKEIKNYQFLVLDDQVADATSRTIESYFNYFAVSTPVHNIQEAMEALKNQEYDFCIIDYCLNDVQNGFEFAEYCERAYPKMACIVYSGKSPKFIPTKFKERYIDKPFGKKKFINLINKYI